MAQRIGRDQFVSLIPVVWLLVAGCASSRMDQAGHPVSSLEESGPAGWAEPDRALRGKAEQTRNSASTPAAEDGDGRMASAGETPAPAAVRHVVYRGWFTLDVHDIPARMQSLMDLAAEMGGFLESRQGNVLVVRIPAHRFEEVTPRLRTLGRLDDTLTRIQAQDVTEEYQDLELRLKTRRDYLDSLRTLLQAGGKLEEKLAVQREIAKVVEEIERLEGRLRLLKQQVALATVTVTLRPAYKGPTQIFRLPWEWLNSLGVEYILQ